jgi:hypothetical protein
MSAQEEIAGLLTEWLELTHGEAAAIQAAAWADVHRFQSGKAGLQRRITQAMDGWNRQKPTDLRDHPFRAQVNRLISLEARNGEMLAVQMSRAKAEMAALVQTGRTLRRIKESYAGKREARWHSYS